MKKILASLLTAYILTNGQAPPDVVTNTAGTTISPQAPASGTSTSTPVVITPAPVTPVPVLITPAPVTPAPVTPAPITTSAAPIRVTPAPVLITTAAPLRVTPAPTTPAPTPLPTTKAPTINGLCPFDAGTRSGLDPQSVQFNENAVCFGPNEVATDYLGRLRCNNYACCQCAQINCGFNGYPCEELRIGDQGAIGVKSINVRGAPEMTNNPLQGIFGGSYTGNGAKIQCSGKDSCLSSIIRGEVLSDAECSGDAGCQDATIIINDPVTQFNMQCNGLRSCERSYIEINVGVAEAAAQLPGQGCNPAFAGVVTELGKVEFNGFQAGQGAKVKLSNKGCGTVLFDAFECMSIDACPGIAVEVEGNVAIRNCDLMGVAPGSPLITSLVQACQAGQNYQNWNPNMVIPGGQVPQQPLPGQPVIPTNPSPGFPVQQPPFIPPNPVNPPPLIPPNPVNPTPVVPAPVTPVVPAPPSPFNPAGPSPPFNPAMPFPFNPVQDPRSLKLQCDQVGFPGMPVPGNPRSCAGTTQTIQIANNFVLDCTLAGACNGMTLTLNAGYDPTRNPIQATTYIDSLKFIQAQSDVTIYINNEFGMNGAPVRINDIRCENPGSCRNLKIIAGPGVDILSTNYDCSSISSCMGASVTQGSTTFPMDPRTMGGFGAPFGAPAAPQTFGQPQQFNPWI